ncbi:MAG: tetratricopeptide repeat protein [Kiritimatiellae bacterium]|nr:tetratricopeptide repeat protein [Kiritimatiellia bacterium]
MKKVAAIFASAVVSAFPAFADEPAAAKSGEAAAAETAQEPPAENPELEAEVAYVEALVTFGFPDFAGPVIEATKKRWPETEARFFAIEVRGLLALGKFDEAEKKIASLPDRKSAKYWAARLEVANNYFGRGQKEDCMKIYGEFFEAFKKPPPEIRKFFLAACYAYGQLLIGDSQFAKAAERYASLLGQLREGDDEWCNVACETVELYLRLANAAGEPSKKKERADWLAKAGKLADKLLWQIEKPVYFGRAVSMKAHIEQMKGDVDKASAIIEEYKPQLQEIHAQILRYDPEGKLGLLKQSPLPECMYLQSKMLWDEAQAEFKKKPKCDDERVKALMFGPKDKSGRRQGSKGAFNMAVNVFLNYETSAWAPAAGDLSEEIKAFAEKQYKAKIKTRVTAEQIAKVRAAQFKEAHEKFLQQRYLEAVDAYYAVLARYPEFPESLVAVENIASCYLDLVLETKDDAKKDEYRMNADAVEGYLAERFSGSPNRAMMMAAGDAVIRLAAKETQYKNPARADALYTAFFVNYVKHPLAATLAASKAGEYRQAERYSDAIKYYGIIAEHYTNTPHYAAALAQLSFCHGKLGDKKEEIDYITRYLDIETVKIRRLQAQFQLAQMYQRDGLEILAAAGTNDAPEAVEADERHGTAQIVRAVKQFNGFEKQAAEAVKDPSTPEADIAKYGELREAAMFIVGECWSRMNRPEKNLKLYRENAAKCYEAYVGAYPEGKFAKYAYGKLGTIYTALGDMAKSKDALDRLSRKFPDSDEAKNAKPRLAKNLIEMGMRREGAEIYAEMLRTDGAYTAQQFVNAGEALIDAKSWDLANQAFNKAVRLAGTNQVVTVAKARLGLAKSSWKQGSLAEAREALDLFLADPKMAKMAIAADANFMLIDVASDQGRTEKDSALRGKCFGAAIGALKKVRQYWKNKPQWEQDRLDLVSGDVLIDRMKAEEAMGLKEEAKETCGKAAAVFQVFLQSHGVSDSRPLDKMEAGEVENLERAYATMVPLFSKLGAEQADRVLKFGQEYLDLFPNGKARTAVANCMNQAKADMPAAKKQ